MKEREDVNMVLRDQELTSFLKRLEDKHGRLQERYSDLKRQEEEIEVENEKL